MYAPGADPASGARPLRDGWAWPLLPAAAQRVGAVGGSLPATLAAAGLQVSSPGGHDLDAVLVDGAESLPEGAWARADVPVIAVALGGGADSVSERVNRARRLAELAWGNLRAAGAARRGRPLERAARAAGREVSVIATTDRARPYLLGTGGPRRPRAGCVVTGSRRPAAPSALDVALGAARAADGRLLAAGVPSVVESGKVIVPLAGEAGAAGAVVRVGGGSAGAIIDRAVGAIAALSAADAPASVRRLMPRVIATGRSGAVVFAAEEWAEGEHPRSVDGRLWSSCREFLEGLRSVPSAAAVAGADVIAADVETLEPLLSDDARRRLEQVAGVVGNRLAGVRLGWAHGDFWPDNLVIRGGELDCVLDWDTADSRELPALDALDLLPFARPGVRWTTFGPRLVDHLLPQVRAGDERLADHCRAVGAPSDHAGLEALAWAWWARRTALTVRDYPDRRARPAWLRDNLERPLLTERLR